MSNIDIRQLLKQRRIYHYEIAEKLGISESYFCRLLRKELAPDKKKQILQIIDELACEVML